MPRANRYLIPDNIYHITHRCHNRDFLLKFRKDRKLWVQWLFEAKKRHNIIVLNYIVTSNHIHILISDNGGKGNISEFMQLIQSRIGQGFNNRKDRKGAFWEDRYRATAIASDEHFIRCMNYISLNMVRAGVVDHPEKWLESGYHEIQYPKKRYVVIDYNSLFKLLNIESIDQLQNYLQMQIKEMLERNELKRESIWTESIAVGNEAFLENIKQRLNIKAKSRKIKKNENGCYELSEQIVPYNTQLDTKK